MMTCIIIAFVVVGGILLLACSDAFLATKIERSKIARHLNNGEPWEEIRLSCSRVEDKIMDKYDEVEYENDQIILFQRYERGMVFGKILYLIVKDRGSYRIASSIHVSNPEKYLPGCCGYSPKLNVLSVWVEEGKISVLFESWVHHSNDYTGWSRNEEYKVKKVFFTL